MADSLQLSRHGGGRTSRILGRTLGRVLGALLAALGGLGPNRARQERAARVDFQAWPDYLLRDVGLPTAQHDDDGQRRLIGWRLQ